MQLLRLLIVIVILCISSVLIRNRIIYKIECTVAYYTMKNNRILYEKDRQTALCCHYRNHYHNCWTGGNSSGCVLSGALIGEIPPTTVCRYQNDGCMPPETMQQHWLEGFTYNCDECTTNRNKITK